MTLTILRKKVWEKKFECHQITDNRKCIVWHLPHRKAVVEHYILDGYWKLEYSETITEEQLAYRKYH